jgi:chromosome segregation ATPase
MADMKSSPVHIMPPQASGTIPPKSAAPQTKPGAKPAPVAKKKVATYRFTTVPFWAGLVVSFAWVAFVGLAMLSSGTTHNFLGLPLAEWALGISAVTAPVGLIWMVAAYLQRASDVQAVAEPLRRQLLLITGESGLAEQRIRRFNQVIREQLELLRNTQTLGHEDLIEIMDRVRQHKAELDQFEQNSLRQVKDIQEVVSSSMQHIEQVMEDKFTMLRILDGKMSQSGTNVAQQTEVLREHLGGLLQEIEANGNLIAVSLERAMQDSKKLSDTARAQESSILSAADQAAGTLGELSGKIDLNIAKFLERASSAREEAERLAGALDAQARSLDEFSTVLPSRVGEAEAVLRGVADRLYASEQLAREQSVQLSEKLSAQIDGLQQMLDRFSARFADIDGTMQQRRGDLDTLVARIGGASDELAKQLENSIKDLGARAEGTLQSFRAVNAEAKQGVEEVSSKLADTAARYQAASAHLNTLSKDSSEQMKGITAEISNQLAQFEKLQGAMKQAGDEVQTRATGAVQNLQYVLERLLSARDATQLVGETLTDKLRKAVDENETLIVRINEAAQMSVRSLGLATESMSHQETDLSDKARAAEAALRDAMSQLEAQAVSAESSMRRQSENLKSLLDDAVACVSGTEARLDDFADRAVKPVKNVMDQIDLRTAEGLSAVERYGENMQAKLDALQQFNAQVGSMGDTVASSTKSALDTIQSLNQRFVGLRTEQEETTRATVEKFNEVAERLKMQIGTLDGHSSQAVQTLQAASTEVSQQARNLLQEAQDASSKMQLVTAALQSEATQTRAALQKQAEDLNADLVRAEDQFGKLGDSLKQRTDVAYSLIDRVAVHYNEITRQTTEEFEERTNKINLATTQANDKVEALNASLRQQLNMIGSGTSQLEGNANAVTSAGSKAVEQLGVASDKFLSATSATTTEAQKTLARVDEVSSAFLRQHAALSENSDLAVEKIQKAATSFGDQATRLMDTSSQVEQQVRNLGIAAQALADQTGQAQQKVEQQSAKMVAGLGEAVAQMDAASSKLQQVVATATLGADQANERFSALTQNASTRIGATSQELLDIASKTDASLTSLGSGLTQQVASLNMVCEQIVEQQKSVASSNAMQQSQLTSLFEKIGSAHAQASDIAEKSVARLGEALQQIQRHLSALMESSDGAVTNVRSAAGGFADQSGLLIQQAQQAEQQARNVLTVTSALQSQAQQLRDSLTKEGEKANDLLSGLLSKLASGSKDLQDLGTSAESTLTGLQISVNQQATTFSTTMQQIGERQKSLMTALDSQRDVLNGLLCRLALAQDETATSAERSVARLTESSQQITKQLETMNASAETALSSIRSSATGFNDEAQKLVSNATEAEKQAKAVLEVTASLQEQAQKMRENLQSEADRTGSVLSDLVGKIVSGSSSLRDAGSATNENLSQLQQKVTEQAADLNSTMQQINERQRTMASALDQQREAVSGVLNRLNLAQDETAAMAERSVARLSESAQQVSKQIEAMDQKAQGTLASVRTVSSSLADETGTLQLQAQQAEQQMRNMLTISSGLQDQAKKMRESMSDEAARVIEKIGQVTAQLENTAGQLKQHSAGAVSAVDQAALQFGSIVNSSCETLQKQADNLSSVAKAVEVSVVASGDRIGTQIKSVADVSELAEQKARNLAETTSYATDRLIALRDTLGSSDEKGREMLAAAMSRLEKVKSGLYDELQHIAEVSDTAVKLVQSSSGKLALESDSLRANLSSSESALTNVADMLREEGTQLPAVMNRGAAQVEAASKALKAQAEAACDTLVKTADRFISTSGATRDTMMDEMRDLDSVTTTAETTLRSFTEALKEHLAAMQTGSGLLATEQQTLVAAANQTLSQLLSANEKLHSLHQDAAATADQVSRAFANVEQNAGSATAKLTQISGNLGKQIEQLVQAASHAEGQLSTSSQSFRDQMERIRSGVQTQIDDINRGLMQITAQLERTGTTLRSAISGTASDVEKLGTRFSQTSQAAADQLSDRTVRMRSATEEVAKLLNGFGDQLDVLLDRLSTAGDGIKRNESDILGQLQTALSQLSSVAERLEANRLLTANVSDQAVSRLAEVADVVEKQIQNFSTGSDTVSSVIRGVGRMYQEQSDTLNRGVTDAQNQVMAMEQTIESLQQRTDRMRVSLKLQGEELVGSLEQILRQLATAGDIMGDTISDLSSRAAYSAEDGKKVG